MNECLCKEFDGIVVRVRLLDVGCCFGTELRSFLAEGASIDNVLAIDVEQRFIDLGFRLYGDEDNTTLKNVRFSTNNRMHIHSSHSLHRLFWFLLLVVDLLLRDSLSLMCWRRTNVSSLRSSKARLLDTTSISFGSVRCSICSRSLKSNSLFGDSSNSPLKVESSSVRYPNFLLFRLYLLIIPSLLRCVYLI